MDEFIGNVYKQNCGDILKILERTSLKRGTNYFYRCQFQKYPYEIFALKGHILRGVVNNPQIEQKEFVEKLWPQNCGDSLRIIEKTNIKQNNTYLWKCEFLTNKYIIYRTKGDIISGKVNNPLKDDFIGTEWLQHCGDILRVLKREKENYVCEFIKYPCKIKTTKGNIIKGMIINPQIDIVEFQNRIWPQNCGDSLRIIEKTKIKKGGNNYLYKAIFINNPQIVICYKSQILEGKVNNILITREWDNKRLLKDFILNNFDYKPSIIQLINKLQNKISESYLKELIKEYDLFEYLNYSLYESTLEKDIRNYCLSIDNSFLEKSTCKELDGKEIDIYSPKLKLGIEVNGDYWHSDEVILRNYNMTSKEKDLLKIQLAKEKGIDLYFIWEHDWKGRQEVVKRYLRILINKYNKL